MCWWEQAGLDVVGARDTAAAAAAEAEADAEAEVEIEAEEDGLEE